jgi:fucose permease
MNAVTSPSFAGDPAPKWRVLAIVASSAFALTGVVTTFLGPILPTLAARWELSDSRSGYFFTAQFLGTMIGVSISSILLPRRGFRFSIGLSYFLMAAGVSGLTSRQWKFALFGTLAYGIGLGIVIPSTNLLISTLNQERRSSALSILNFCWGIGAVVAPVALAIAEHWNHMPVFVPALSGFLLVSAIILVFAPEGPPHREERTSDLAQGISNWPWVLILGAMFCLYVAIESSIGGWIATLAERAPSGAGQGWVLAPALFWAGLLAGRGLTPLVLRRMSERILTLISLVIACSGICILVVSSHRQWITIAGMVVGWGLAAVFPITIALLSHFRGMEKRIAGPMFGLAGLGGAVMPWLVGAISTWSGSLQTGLLSPLLAAIILLCLHAVANHGVQPVVLQATKSSSDSPSA